MTELFKAIIEEFKQEFGITKNITKREIKLMEICYQKMVVKNFSIPNVVGQSEQLCDHPRSERSYIGQNMLRCNKCGKEFS